MTTKSAADSFIGLGGLIFISGLLCFPFFGWGSVIAALAAIYFGVVVVNGADSSAKRQNKNRRKR